MYILYLFENDICWHSLCTRQGRGWAWQGIYEYLHSQGQITTPPEPDIVYPGITVTINGHEITVKEWLKAPENARWKVYATLNNQVTI